jgi:hypothetical protein
VDGGRYAMDVSHDSEADRQSETGNAIKDKDAVTSFGPINAPGANFGEQVFLNGGITVVAEYLRDALVTGVVGNAAWAVLGLGAKHARLRLSWQAESQQRPYVSSMVQLAVAAKLEEKTQLDVSECRKLDDHWAAVVKAGDKTYRVRVPLKEITAMTISVDLD